MEYLPLIEESEINQSDLETEDVVYPPNPKLEESIVETDELDEEDYIRPEIVTEVSNETFGYLLNEFERSIFWTDKRNHLLVRFVADEKLKLELSKELFEKLIFDNNLLFRDDVVNIMIYPPNLLDRKNVADSLAQRILKFIDELKEEKE